MVVRRVFLLVAIAALIASAAWAQQGPACTWGAPKYTKAVDARGASMTIKVPCGGGVVGCKGELDVSFYVWDPLLQDWVLWGPPGMEPDEYIIFRNCGSTFAYTETVAHAKFPPRSLVCITFDWYVWAGGWFQHTDQENHIYWTP